MKRLVMAGLLVAATGAQALDCAAPQPARNFMTAEARAQDIVIVMGRFVFDASLMPGDDAPEGVVYPAIPGQFTGHGLTRDGFTAPMAISVAIQPECLNPWCGHFAPTTAPVIAFLQVTGSAYLLPVEPCGSGIYPADDATIALFTACMRGETCADLTE